MNETKSSSSSGRDSQVQSRLTDSTNPAASRTGSTSTEPRRPFVPPSRSGSEQVRPAATKRVFRHASVLLIPLMLTSSAFLGYRWLDHSRTWTSTDNAYVSAHVHTVSARVAGTVQEVLVEENHQVSAGSVMARLDPRDFEVKRQLALAQTAQAAAQRRQVEAQIAVARSQVAREEARARKAELDRARAESLFQGAAGAISKQEFEQARADSEAAEAAVQGAQSGLESATAQAAAAEALEKVAQANLQEAELQLSYTELRAPAAGRVGRKSLEVGNRVQPGQGLVALVQPDVWLIANFKETQVARMRPGQNANIRFDAFPGKVFKGTVESLSPASGSQFALLPPDNATGNFTRIIQRIPIKIVLQKMPADECERLIVAGMSAIVEVRVRE